jgi:hypothetical protein
VQEIEKGDFNKEADNEADANTNSDANPLFIKDVHN